MGGPLPLSGGGIGRTTGECHASCAVHFPVQVSPFNFLQEPCTCHVCICGSPCPRSRVHALCQATTGTAQQGPSLLAARLSSQLSETFASKRQVRAQHFPHCLLVPFYTHCTSTVLRVGWRTRAIVPMR